MTSGRFCFLSMRPQLWWHGVDDLLLRWLVHSYVAHQFSLASLSPHITFHFPGPPHVVGLLTAWWYQDSHTSQVEAGFQETGSESCQSPKLGFRNCCDFTLAIFSWSKELQNPIRFKEKDTKSPFINGKNFKELVAIFKLQQSAPWSQLFIFFLHAKYANLLWQSPKLSLHYIRLMLKVADLRARCR